MLYHRHVLSASILLAVTALTACQPAPEATKATNDAPIENSQTVQAEPEAPTTKPTATEINATPITILALGDSLTEGLGVSIKLGD